jgi:hypothetical protein
MPLTMIKAKELLMKRYSISPTEAKKCYESDMSILYLASKDAWGKRIPGAKTFFTDESDYNQYLDCLEDWR